ncbi:MAG: thermonuclease family protein [Patescibacteria group bacterium]
MLNNRHLLIRLPEELLQYCRLKKNISGYVRTLIKADRRKKDPNYAPDIRAKSQFIFSAKLLKVVDGDTVSLDADLGFYVRAQIIVRLAGLDVPPANTEAGKKATDFITARLLQSHIIVESKRKDKYGRYLAYIYYHRHHFKFEDILRYGRCINDELIKNDLAQKMKDQIKEKLPSSK